MAITAGTVMDGSAVLLNDKDKVAWTYSVLLPYLKLALDELELEYANNGMPTIKEISAAIDVPASSIPSGIAGPNDMMAPIEVFERLEGETSEDSWRRMTQVKFEDNRAASDRLLVWDWREEEIKVPPCTVAREIKIHYYKEISEPANENTNLSIENAKLALTFKTAAFAAEFGGAMPTRAESLHTKGDRYLNRVIGRDIKSMQGMPARRRPFGYRRKLIGSVAGRR